MAMDERVSKFVTAITKEAEEKRSAIENETKAFVEAEMKKAESEVLQESFQLIQHAAANIRSDAGSRISAGRLESKRALLCRREEIIEEVLSAVKDKVRKFAESAEYEAFLKKSAEKGKEIFGDGLRAFMRPEDMKYAAAVAAVTGCDPESDSSIELGGLKFSDSAGFKFADDTFDSRMALGRDWFVKNSGLAIPERQA